MKKKTKNKMPSFLQRMKKAMGEKWSELSPGEKKTMRELSKCEKGGGRPPLDEPD